MRNMLLATIVFAAQSLLPFGADVCACDAHPDQNRVVSCCQQQDVSECDCGCQLAPADSSDTETAVITHAPLPALTAVLADQRAIALVTDGHEALASARSVAVAIPAVPLPRAERAPPA